MYASVAVDLNTVDSSLGRDNERQMRPCFLHGSTLNLSVAMIVKLTVILLLSLCLAVSILMIKEEEDKDDESKDVSIPTHWAKLDPKSMKVRFKRKDPNADAKIVGGMKRRAYF